MKGIRTFLAWLPALALVASVLLSAAPAGAVTYSAMPDQDPRSGKFINLTRGFDSLGEAGTRLEIEVLTNALSFEIGVFDGDIYRNVAGNGTTRLGRWDRFEGGLKTDPLDHVVYTLYADPGKTGSMETVVQTVVGLNPDGTPITQPAQWSTDQIGPNGLPLFPDDGWFSAIVLTVPGCRFYNLVADWKLPFVYPGNEQNNFKLRSTGSVFLLADSNYGFMGFGGPIDGTDGSNVFRYPKSTYNGTWDFGFYVPSGVASLEFWDGDFDRVDDTHDGNSPTVPPSTPEDPFTLAPTLLGEGVSGGSPQDDWVGTATVDYRISPSIRYTVTAPNDAWVAPNENPSGNREWELFRLSASAADQPDKQVPSIPEGWYTWQMQGVDSQNTLFIHPKYDIYQPGSLGNFVWYDTNGDGLQDDGEVGAEGVTVQLYRVDVDPVTEDETHVRVGMPQTTAANGSYLFSNLPPADYYVVFSDLPNGYKFTDQDVGSDDGRDSDPNAQGATEAASLFRGENDLSWDAGLIEAPKVASLGDRVWNDLNHDGVQGDEEQGVNNVFVMLYASPVLPNAVPVATMWTGQLGFAQGEYKFDNLLPGDYVVRFIRPEGFAFTWKDKGDNGKDSDADLATGWTVATTLDPGENDLTWDAGLFYAGDRTFRTQTQGGWGSKPKGNNPGAFLAANFQDVYPNGVTIGGVKTITLLSAKAVEDFLPQGGTPGSLTVTPRYIGPAPLGYNPPEGESVIDAPKQTEAGVLAGQVLALQLSVDFSNAGLSRPGLQDLKIGDGPLAGKFVWDVLALGNAVLGGGGLPPGVSITDLNETLTNCNENFVDGSQDNGYLK